MSLLSIVRVGVSFCRTAFLASVRVHYMILGCFISSWFFLVSSGVRARVSVCVCTYSSVSQLCYRGHGGMIHVEAVAVLGEWTGSQQ